MSAPQHAVIRLTKPQVAHVLDALNQSAARNRWLAEKHADSCSAAGHAMRADAAEELVTGFQAVLRHWPTHAE